MPEISLYHRIKSGRLKVTRRSPLLHKFWVRVDKEGPTHPVHGKCWVWTGSHTTNGYGQLRTGKRNFVAHRLAYHFLVGPVPPELCVCHHCDNPICVNPTHLFLGTSKDNHDDMVRKGRRVEQLGSKNGAAKLTVEDVLEIRRRHRVWNHQRTNTSRLAKRFKITPMAVRLIVNRQRWKHV